MTMNRFVQFLLGGGIFMFICGGGIICGPGVSSLIPEKVIERQIT